MDTTASRGGVAPDGAAAGASAGEAGGAGGAPGAGSGRVRVEVEAMPDGRTIRYFATASHVSGSGGYDPQNQTHAAEPQ